MAVGHDEAENTVPWIAIRVADGKVRPYLVTTFYRPVRVYESPEGGEVAAAIVWRDSIEKAHERAGVLRARRAEFGVSWFVRVAMALRVALDAARDAYRHPLDHMPGDEPRATGAR